jgi:hypothetical protein
MLKEAIEKRVIKEAKGRQPRQGNVKLTISVKAETRERLKELGVDKHEKHNGYGLGAVIDNLMEDEQAKCSRCGSLKPVFKNLDTKEFLCEDCTVQYLIEQKKEKECTAPNSNSTNMTS